MQYETSIVFYINPPMHFQKNYKILSGLYGKLYDLHSVFLYFVISSI